MAGSGSEYTRKEAAKAVEEALKSLKLQASFTPNSSSIGKVGCLNPEKTKIKFSDGSEFPVTIVGNPPPCCYAQEISPGQYLAIGPKPQFINIDGKSDRGKLIVQQDSNYYVRTLASENLYELNMSALVGVFFILDTVQFSPDGKSIVVCSHSDLFGTRFLKASVINNFKLTTNPTTHRKVVTGFTEEHQNFITLDTLDPVDIPPTPPGAVNWTTSQFSSGSSTVTCGGTVTNHFTHSETSETNYIPVPGQEFYIQEKGTRSGDADGIFIISNSSSKRVVVDYVGGYTCSASSYNFFDLLSTVTRVEDTATANCIICSGPTPTVYPCDIIQSTDNSITWGTPNVFGVVDYSTVNIDNRTGASTACSPAVQVCTTNFHSEIDSDYSSDFNDPGEILDGTLFGSGFSPFPFPLPGNRLIPIIVSDGEIDRNGSFKYSRNSNITQGTFALPVTSSGSNGRNRGVQISHETTTTNPEFTYNNPFNGVDYDFTYTLFTVEDRIVSLSNKNTIPFINGFRVGFKSLSGSSAIFMADGISFGPIKKMVPFLSNGTPIAGTSVFVFDDQNTFTTFSADPNALYGKAYDTGKYETFGFVGESNTNFILRRWKLIEGRVKRQEELFGKIGSSLTIVDFTSEPPDIYETQP